MRKYLFIIFLTVSFLSVNPVKAQDLKIGFTIGSVNLQNAYTYAQKGFVINTDWNSGRAFGLTIKYTFPNSPFKFSTDFIMAKLDGGGYYSIINPAANSRPVPVDTKAELLNLNSGLEWIITKGKFSPYIGANINFLSFGDVQIDSYIFNTITVPDGEYFGGGLTGGLEIQLVNYLMLDLNARYLDYDLFARSKHAEQNLRSINLMASIYVTL